MDINNFNKNDKRNALWLGSIVGDAFVLGGHWIYDLKKLQSSFPNYNSPQMPLSGSFHKNKKLGDQTHYGDQARHLWKYLSEQNGNYEPEQYRKEWMKFIKSYDGYMDQASRESLTALKNNLQFGSSSDELGGVARVAAIYYWIEDSEQALAFAIDQNRMTHDSQQAIVITVLIAKTLELLLAKTNDAPQISVFDALDKTRIQMIAEDKYDMKAINDMFDAAKDLHDLSAKSIAEKLGQSCHAKHALPAILAVLRQPDDYQRAMQINVMIGGDSATRAMIIGALLGAKLGTKSIPQEWVEVMHN